MYKCPPHLQADFYKFGHKDQHPKDLRMVYSNFTPRGTRRIPYPEGIVWFGLQAWIKDYLISQWNENFFTEPREKVMKQYKRVVDNCLGPGMDINHIGELHELGYLPLLVKSLPEGVVVPYRVPAMTIRNTHPDFAWLTNKLETVMSNSLWLPTTSATTALQFRRTFEDYADTTGADKAFIQWQGHDFSMRGMEGLWGSEASGAGHLLFFTGTDTVPAILWLEQFYGANIEKELVGASVPATEHSVMCLSLKEGELELFKRLITEVYPKGIVSIVSDTWSLKKVVTDYLPRLKNEILAREGKVVIRPDSGDPVKIICGDPQNPDEFYREGLNKALYGIFGGTTNDRGYRSLDPHIGWIYGDSISLERQQDILFNLMCQGFASSTPVLGIGSYTYQHVTRDTDGWAMKATYAETDSDGPVSLFKDPETDDGVKKSAKGLLQVRKTPDGTYELVEDVNWEDEAQGELKPVFCDGALDNEVVFSEVRARALRNV